MTHLVIASKDKNKNKELIWFMILVWVQNSYTVETFATNPDGEIKSKATFHLYGQENTGEMYATCKSDMLLGERSRQN
jgi:hypothetical protein